MALLLNRRFRDGRPSGDLASAGVLIHQFDGILFGTDGQRPWQSQAFFSAFLTNSKMRASASGGLPLFSDSAAGVVLAPTVHVICSYHTDGMRFGPQPPNQPHAQQSASASTVAQ